MSVVRRATSAKWLHEKLLRARIWNAIFDCLNFKPRYIFPVSDPQTSDEWLHLSRNHEVAAKTLCENKVAAGQALFHVGLSVEAALKAMIMKRERFNAWPSKATRPELYTHRLRDLLVMADISLSATAPTAASWHVVLAWDRNQAYDPKVMPRKVARAWVEAAFGEKGAVTWIRTTLA